MTAEQALEAERKAQMAPFLPWCTAEPCVRLPTKAVLIDKKNDCCYVTLKDLAEALKE